MGGALAVKIKAPAGVMPEVERTTVETVAEAKAPAILLPAVLKLSAVMVPAPFPPSLEGHL
jgi:hypothetical protein